MPQHRRDHNHQAIAAALRQVGCVVIEVYMAPGALDLLVGYRQRWILLEAKNLEGRGLRLTPAELETIRLAETQGLPVHVVTSIDEALIAVGL